MPQPEHFLHTHTKKRNHINFHSIILKQAENQWLVSVFSHYCVSKGGGCHGVVQNQINWCRKNKTNSEEIQERAKKLESSMKCILECSVSFPGLGFKGPSSNKYQDHHSFPQHMAAAYFWCFDDDFYVPIWKRSTGLKGERALLCWVAEPTCRW